MTRLEVLVPAVDAAVVLSRINVLFALSKWCCQKVQRLESAAFWRKHAEYGDTTSDYKTDWLTKEIFSFSILGVLQFDLINGFHNPTCTLSFVAVEVNTATSIAFCASVLVSHAYLSSE